MRKRSGEVTVTGIYGGIYGLREECSSGEVKRIDGGKDGGVEE